ncbi:MAG: hypothetical protein FWD26_07070 [Treponema sp.]|nr:hypothetical protein [Treponema sp.]
MCKYSIKKILKNKIGYIIIIPLIIFIIVTVLALIIFGNNTLLFIILTFPSITLSILFLIVFTYSIYNIIKINYYFKYGIESNGIVIDDNYDIENKYSRSSQYLFYKILSPWNIQEVSTGQFIRLDKKIGVIIKYLVDNEERENTYNYRINNETMYIKNGSKINILINPKNKNEIIIKDIFSRG